MKQVELELYESKTMVNPKRIEPLLSTNLRKENYLLLLTYLEAQVQNLQDKFPGAYERFLEVVEELKRREDENSI